MRLENIIAELSPRWALRRQQARVALGYLRAVEKRGYDGGKRGRRTDGWRTNGTAANVEITRDTALLRDRARDLVRNNPYAAKAVSVYGHNLVGTGITPRPKTKHDELNKLISELWEEWIRVCDASGHTNFYGLQKLIGSSRFESGECLIRRRRRLPKDGMRVPFQLEVLEADHLDRTKDGATANGGIIVRGIEFDAIGRRVAYWLWPEHPGESSRLMRKGFQSKRIAADDVIHHYRKERPGQDFGVTDFAPVIMKLRDVDGYDEAELIRKQIAATFCAFRTTTDGSGSAPIGEQSTEEDTGAKLEKMRPGTIYGLPPGEQITFASPPADQFYQQFLSVQLHAISAGLRMPYELFTGDFSNVNYSSFRGALIEFRRLISTDQWGVFIPGVCERVWQWFIDTAFIAGLVPEQNYAVEWSPPPFETVDPEKDAKANQYLVRMGLKSWPQAVAEQGYDPEEQIEEIAKANAMFDAKGLVLDCDARKVNKTGTQHGATKHAQTEETDDAETE